VLLVLGIAWLLRKEPVTAPIIGATKITHLEDTIGALSIRLTQEEIEYLEEPYVPHPSSVMSKLRRAKKNPSALSRTEGTYTACCTSRS
jgi:diketogulonate reductase-like aldo/keto reductase